MEERAKREERNGKAVQERMVGLEEKNRKLMDIIKAKNINGPGTTSLNDDLD